MSFLLTSRTSEQGPEFPASGELREVFARSGRPSLPTRHHPRRRLVVSGVEADDVPDLDETVLVAGYRHGCRAEPCSPNSLTITSRAEQLGCNIDEQTSEPNNVGLHDHEPSTMIKCSGIYEQFANMLVNME